MGNIQHLENCTCNECGKKRPMVHIHIHSDHSNLDGVNKISNLVKKANDFGHKALVLNDHGNPSGIYSFYKECKKYNIKPILGLEFYITNDLRQKKSRKDREGIEDNDYHQSIFIKNDEGYVNYNYMTYVSHTEGYYYKPRIDFDLLFERKNGLIATSSCIASKVNQYLTLGMTLEAEQLFKKFRDEFGDDFFAEIQLNELNSKEVYGINQRANNEFIIKMARKFDVPILIGGDIHYTDPEDNELQDTVINIKQRTKEGEEGFKIHARSLYYSDSPDIFRFNKEFGFNYDEAFINECLDNSLLFAEKPNFEFKTGKYHMPKINTGDNSIDSDKFLEKLCYIKLAEKINIEKKYYTDKWTAEYLEVVKARIKEELRVIKKLELSDYLLIVYDIINFEKSNGIFVGPGRGSAAGSFVAYLLSITGLDPIEHDLLFERFINEHRKVMCLTEDNLILMKDGSKKYIKDLTLEDSAAIQTRNNNELIMIKENEVDEEIYILEDEDGNKIKVTSQHIIPVIRNNQRIEIKANEVLESDNLIIY